MSLMDAPSYDPTSDRRKRAAFIALGVFLVVGWLFTFAGYAAGHGWAFSNVPYEHQVNEFFTALEAKDYNRAYGLYNGDTHWQEHPEKFTRDYPLSRFTEDWTTYSPTKGPITSHQTFVSHTDGSGAFGSGVIVATCLNGNKRAFMYVLRGSREMSFSPRHELQFKGCGE